MRAPAAREQTRSPFLRATCGCRHRAHFETLRTSVTEPPGRDPGDRSLARRYRNDGDTSARDELVERHLGLARHLALRYRHTAESLDDLVQVANLALVKAAERYDPDYGTAFASFAVPTVLGELKRHFRDHSWSVRVPRELQERVAKVNEAIEVLSKETGRSPTVPAIAERLNLDMEQVLEAMEAGRAYDARSLDGERERDGDEAPPLLETVGREDPGYELAEYAAAIGSTLEEMPDRTREILHLRFSEDLTQSEIAERVGISQMHVSRLIRGAVADLRAAADDSPQPADEVTDA